MCCRDGGVGGGVAPLDTALGRLRQAIAVRAGTAEEVATLFVALLRAHGLEARLVRCVNLTQDSQAELK